MIKATYDWVLNEETVDATFLTLAKKEGLTELAAKLIWSRGIDDAEKLAAFLQPDLSQLHDPYALHDMERAVKRLRKAIAEGERILVYGDYDADGMTSTSILKEALEMLGADLIAYLPNRFTDGYGPNQSIYRYFIEQQEVSLIVTVDNGVSGHEAIAYAQNCGVDVIVTDHHSLPADLPEAYAVIHPEHPEAAYPFKALAGCGVAFKLACALLETVPTELLDLVAIGTIADMVPLTGENRILVKTGLEMLKQTERIGLLELMALSDIDLASLNEETVAFTLAPQLNALGRLDDPSPALDLLTGFDEDEAQSIAQLIKAKNEERKTLVQQIYAEALEQVDPTKPVQVLAKEGWHPGVLGIVAGKLLETLNQPVLVLGITEGVAKGSARSVEAIDLFQALDPHRQLFMAFGGHSGAAGMTLAVEALDALSEVLCDYIKAHQVDLTAKSKLRLDDSLVLADISLETVKGLERLAPFGMGNPKPAFFLTDIEVKQVRQMGQNGAHLKLKVQQGETECDLIAFYQGGLAQEFQQVRGLELAVTLSVNRWNGVTSLQLLMTDARVSGVQLFDIRAKHMALPAGVPILTPEVTGEAVVLLDVPQTEKELRALFRGKTFSAIYFKNQIAEAYYLTGFGTRDQFARLYKTIYQFPEFDIRYKLKELSRFLNIPDLLLVKMIKIFEELGFVRISDGVMSVVKEAPKRDIGESTIYQDLVTLVRYQERLALEPPHEIYRWLYESEE